MTTFYEPPLLPAIRIPPLFLFSLQVLQPLLHLIPAPYMSIPVIFTEAAHSFSPSFGCFFKA